RVAMPAVLSERGRGVQTTRTLSGQWLIAADPGNVGRGERWFQAARKDAKPAPVPGIIQQVFPDKHGVFWYYHSFDAADVAAHERALIKFDIVDYFAEVWLNGQLLGQHEGGETPFAFDATQVLKSTS